ncbi:MAG: DUF3021 domain-containing protein [Ruminococcus sp.]|nr:DUF3021 domain-containing protein [Ruminococcus sp.]MBR4622833.1 DUF3021 domain-containing protein [Ruminococcus sp.]
MLGRVLKRAGLGFLLGMAMGDIIAYITFTGSGMPVAPEFVDKVGSEAAAFLIQTVLSGLIGAAGVGGMLFYEIESWSMLRTMLTHFALISAVFLTVSRVLCWMTAVSEMLIMEGIMLAAYLIVWVIICAVYRAQVKDLNALQDELNKSCKGEKNKSFNGGAEE